jgi:hypothetical protein
MTMISPLAAAALLVNDPDGGVELLRDLYGVVCRVAVDQHDLVNPRRDRAENVLKVTRLVLSRDNDANAGHDRDPYADSTVVGELASLRNSAHPAPPQSRKFRCSDPKHAADK